MRLKKKFGSSGCHTLRYWFMACSVLLIVAWSQTAFAQNQTPSATNMSQLQPYTEGAASVDLDDIVVSDADDPGEVITAILTLDDTSTGLLTADSGNGESYDDGTGVWTVTGSTTVVNDALADVVFVPEPDNDVDTFITTHVEDDEGAAPADGSITLDVTPENDTPGATNLTQTQGYSEDALTVELDDIVVTDPDTGETITASLTLDDTSTGSLTAASGNGESYDGGTGIWTITGSTTAVNDALADVAFIPASDNETDSSVTTHIEDGTGTGPADGSITLDVTPVNDQPSATNMDQTQPYTEGAFSVPLTDIVVTDVDTDEQITATLTLADVSAGELTTTGGGSFDAGVWTASGTVGDVNAALAAVAFEPEEDYDIDTSIAVSIADGGEDGAVELTGTITLDVTAVNDQPEATNLDQTVDYTEDDPSVPLADIVITDVDTDEEITATLTLADVSAGELTTTGGGAFDAGVWTISDTVANVNAALAAVAFEPAQDYDTDTTIAVNVADGGEDGAVELTGTITLDVTPVNDAPYTPDFDQTTDEDGVLTIVLLDYVEDVDSDINPPWNQPPEDEGVEVQVTQGVLGSVNINILEGEIIYTPFADEFGDDSFSYRVSDGELASTGTVSVTVTSVNDTPFAGNDSASVTPGDPAVIISVLDNDGDPDGSLDPSTVQIVAGQEPEHGEAVVDPEAGTIAYTLDAALPDDFAGEDTFMYEVYDDDDTNPLSATATVTVLVSPANFVVDSLLDEQDDDISDGNLSLREAIAYIMDGGLIEFEPDLFAGGQQTITLAVTDAESVTPLLIDKSLTIRGPGADLLVISGDELTRVFDVENGSVAIEEVTIADGHVLDGEGAGIRVGIDGTLVLTGCNVTENEVADDNGEYDDIGGGAFNAGSLTLVNCTVSANTAAAAGGGIYSEGTLEMVNCTVSGNAAANMDGGGMLVAAGSAEITNCTVTGNTAVGGGGLSSELSGIATINNSIISANTAAGGADVLGIVNSNGYNLVGDGEGSAESFDGTETGFHAASLIETVLRYNGGHLPTHSLLADSAAIDAGDNSAVPAYIGTDQRGAEFERILGDAVDVGAYEVRRFVVTTSEDTDDVMAGVDTSPESLSLREAIALTYPGDSITFGFAVQGAQIVLDPITGELIVDSNLAIIGPGADQLTISGGGSTQILYIPSADVDAVISGLSFEDAYDNERGGSVIYNFGTVRMSNCVMANNVVGDLDGGAIHNRGSMSLTDCILNDNIADNLGGAIVCWDGVLVLNRCILTGNETRQMGGAIFNMLGGTVTMNYCTLSDNSADLNGGALYNSADSTLTLSGCTVAGNTAPSDAGGIFNSGVLTLTNSTVSANTAGRNGGGLFQTGGSAAVTNCTIIANLADSIGNGFAEGGGICHTGGELSLHNSIVAGNFDTVDNIGLGNKYPDISGTATSLGANIVGDGNGVTGVEDGVNGDSVGTSSARIDPVLLPLADNGGPTQTHAPAVLSPAIDAGDNEAVVAPVFEGPPFVDQRGAGYPRVMDGNGDGEAYVDIGAVEFVTVLPGFTSTPVTQATEDVLYEYDVVAADSDVGDQLTIDGTELPGWLALDDHGDGTATLHGTPTNEDVGVPYDSGQHDVVLTVTDWAGGSTSQEFTIHVAGVNDAPAPGDDNVSTNEDESLTIDVLANDSDPDGNVNSSTVSIVAGQGPAHGTATVNVPAGTVVYVPDADFNGTDHFVYSVFDDGTPMPSLAATATVTVTVEAVNDAPNAVLDTASTFEDTPVTINVLDNDSDLDGELVPEIVIVSSAPAHGDTGIDTETGAVIYTPNPDFYGTDTFRYRAFDDGSPLPPLSSDATVVVTVAPVNDPPSPEDDSAATQEDTPVSIDVLLNDFDIDGSIAPESVTVVDGPGNGTTSVDPATGAVVYTPSRDFVGTDSFVYEVSDDGVPEPQMAAAATVTVTVTPVNDPPAAEDDAAYTLIGTPVTIDVLGNDDDVDGNILPDSVAVISGPSNGSASVDSATGSITYVPDPEYAGTDSLVYEVSDDGSPLPARSSAATVYVEVGDQPGQPRTYYVDAANVEPGNGSRDNPFPTIGAALSATTAFRGDTVLVMPGAYAENVQMKPGMNLIGVDGAFHTSIVPAAEAPVGKDVHEVLTLADGCVVRGISFGYAPTGAKLPVGITAELTNCVFHSCDVGLYASPDSVLVLNNNTIYGNWQTGLFADVDAVLLSIKNNIVVGNEVGISAESVLLVDGGFNMFFDNGQDYNGIEPFETDFSENPMFVDEVSFNFHLAWASPGLDAGDPDESFYDRDGSRNDLGADGGPNGVIDDLAPAPVVVTSPSPASGDAPLTIQFDGSASLDEWGIASYEWDFDALNGVQVDATGSVAQHTYEVAGTFYATLVVTDNSGLTNAKTVQVIVGEPPVATVSAAPAADAAPLTVQFTCDAFDPDGGQLTYAWDFEGVGQVDSTIANPQYTYSEVAGYSPTVAVTDDEGVVTVVDLPITVTRWAVEAAAEVDETGGEVSVADDGSSLAGASIEVPALTLSDPAVITVGSALEPPSAGGSMILLTPFETGPQGTHLSQLVTVTVPWPDYLSAGRDYGVRYFDYETQTWTSTGVRHVRRVEQDYGLGVQFHVARLGVFAVVGLLEPDVNGDGEVDATDVQLTINAVLGIDISPYDADINADGVIDAVDIQNLINVVLNDT